jgi:cell wall-active antibiotic response 4TMS protein YvqF
MADQTPPFQSNQPSLPAPVQPAPLPPAEPARRVACHCSYCLIKALFGPIMIITVGVLFLIGQYSDRWSFGQLWPFLLIVAGILKVAEAMAPRDGHPAS